MILPIAVADGTVRVHSRCADDFLKGETCVSNALRKNQFFFATTGHRCPVLTCKINECTEMITFSSKNQTKAVNTSCGQSADS